METRQRPTGVASPSDRTSPSSSSTVRSPSATAYLNDANSQDVARRVFADLGLIEGQVLAGDIDKAIDQLSGSTWPRFLIVDVSGVGDPARQMTRLAEIADPATTVIAVGEHNDIVLYRDLKAAGVAEYFYKPLFHNLLSRTLANIDSGTTGLPPSRDGHLVYVLGVRGGVGATMIATNLAWYFANIRERRVLLVDLDLHAGDAALQLDTKPTSALREALDDPDRIDELFLERGVIPIDKHLGLLAGLEPLLDCQPLKPGAIQAAIQKTLAHYRIVIVDLPADIARSFPDLLQMPSTLLLVSDGSLAAIRDVARWRGLFSADRQGRNLIHVLNKKDAEGALPEREMLQVIPQPHNSVRWDSRIMAASALGVKAVRECSAIQEWMETVSAQLSGPPPEDRPFWKRIFS